MVGKFARFDSVQIFYEDYYLEDKEIIGTILCVHGILFNIL